jgi:transposase
VSASSKPPRSFSTKPPTPEQVARVLLDAQTFGDKAAAKRHGIHYKTVSNWRARYFGDPEVEQATRKLRAEITKGWIDEARDTRRFLVHRTKELAGKSKRLDRVTNALRRIHEVVLSHEILNDPDDADDQHHGPDQPADPREGEASHDAEGGGETTED